VGVFHSESTAPNSDPYPADPTTVGKLLHIVQHRLDSLAAEAEEEAEGREGKEDNSSGSSTLLSEPLHILVMGVVRSHRVSTVRIIPWWVCHRDTGPT